MSSRTVDVRAFCRGGTRKTHSTPTASSFQRISTVIRTSSAWSGLADRTRVQIRLTTRCSRAKICTEPTNGTRLRSRKGAE